jgi:hypothetical protein
LRFLDGKKNGFRAGKMVTEEVVTRKIIIWQDAGGVI